MRMYVCAQDIELQAYDPSEFTNGVHKDWITVEKILEADSIQHRR